MKKTIKPSIWQNVIFGYAAITYFLSELLYCIAPIALYRFIDSEKVTYPFMWMLKYEEYIGIVLNFPLLLIPVDSGWDGLGQLIVMIFLWSLLLMGIILVLGYKIIHRRSTYIFLVVAVLILNPISAVFIRNGVTVAAIKLSMSTSKKYQQIKTSFENSAIGFTLDSVKLIGIKPPSYNSVKQTKVYEITLSVKHVPPEMKRFTLLFNEGEFDDYQINRNYFGSVGTWAIAVVQENGTLSFYDRDTQAKLNTDKPNQVRFKMVMDLKKDKPAEIAIKPRIDITFSDPLTYSELDSRFSYAIMSPDLINADYPKLLLEQ